MLKTKEKSGLGVALKNDVVESRKKYLTVQRSNILLWKMMNGKFFSEEDLGIMKPDYIFNII